MIRADVGGVTEADVQLAESVGGAIIGFNVNAVGKAASLAEEAAVPLQTHRIVYELADGVKALLENAMDPIIEEKVRPAPSHAQRPQIPRAVRAVHH